MILAFPLAGPLGGFDALLDLNNISRMLYVVAVSSQTLETAQQQVLRQRTLENAVGANLDVIGKLVGQPRVGLDDDTYRRYCRASITANKSRGTAEELIDVADLVIFEDDAVYVVTIMSVAAVIVRVTEIGITDDLAQVTFNFLRRAASAGVRLVLEYGNTWPLFTFDSGPGFDEGHFGGQIDH